jgi:hypothetical protein
MMKTQDQTQALTDRLANMAPPHQVIGKTTVRARCFAVMPLILRKLAAGHTYKELCNVFAADGLIVTPTTLAQYAFLARRGGEIQNNTVSSFQASANKIARNVQSSTLPIKTVKKNEQFGDITSTPTVPAVNTQSNSGTQALLAKLSKRGLTGSTRIQRQN